MEKEKLEQKLTFDDQVIEKIDRDHSKPSSRDHFA